MTAVENNVTATNQVVESTETEDGITLMDLFRIVRKHILWGIITFVAVFAAVCAYTFLVPPKYSATAQVFATYSDSSAQDNILPTSAPPARTSPTRFSRIRRWPPRKPC